MEIVLLVYKKYELKAKGDLRGNKTTRPQTSSIEILKIAAQFAPRDAVDVFKC